MGEERKLEIIARLSGSNFKVKDLDTTEIYTMEELLRWGIGKDYELDECIDQGNGLVPKKF